MGILDQLLGNGELQRGFKDFVRRFEQGHPSEGYSDREVVDRYGEVAHAVPEKEYAQAVQEALARLSPDERDAFLKMLRERAQAKGVSLPSQAGPDPRDLGRVVTDLHRTPGRLRDILAGSDAPTQTSGPNPLAGLLASPLAKAALAGITAMLVKRVMQGSTG